MSFCKKDERQQAIRLAKELYGEQGKKLLKNCFKEDDLKEELKELEYLQSLTKNERIAYKKYKNKLKIKELERMLYAD